jgi:transposase InsO family protein
MDQIQAARKVKCSKSRRIHPRYHAPLRNTQPHHHRFGFPFTAIDFRNWVEDYGISIDYASVAHPEANGQVERANGLILAGLKPRLYEELEDYGSKWIEELPKVVWELHTQVSRATGYSPFFS